MPMPFTTTAMAAGVQWVCAVLRQAPRVAMVTITVTEAEKTHVPSAAAIHTAVVQAAVRTATTEPGEAHAALQTVHHTATAARHAVQAQVQAPAAAEDSVLQAAAAVSVPQAAVSAVAVAVASAVVVDVKNSTLTYV